MDNIQERAKILTEEELYAIENSYALYTPALAERYPDVVNLIASHRSLLSANAELSFKNMKLKESLKKVNDHLEGVMHPKRLVMLDCPWMHKTINQSLEETK